MLLVLVAAGCGGETERVEPRIPSALALDLAKRSEAVADALAVGDPCDAAAKARELRAIAVAGVNGGTVPPPFQEHLVGAVNGVVERIDCVRPG